MKRLFALFVVLALAGLAWRLSLVHRHPVAAEAQQWVCPMRCLNRAYDKPGECPVCHMKLKPFVAEPRKLLGYSCPLHRSEKIFEKSGTCPFCGLTLKEHWEGAAPPLPASAGLRQWPQLDGKTAVYFRAYEVRPIGVEHILRGAGPLNGTLLSLRLPKEQAAALKKGDSAMVTPPQGYARPVLATLESKGANGALRLRLVRPIPGVDWANAELRVATPPALAVPLPALFEEDGRSRVYVMQGERFEPRTVTVSVRGESYAAVQGLAEGESVAASGVFWLDAEWRLAHP